MHVLLRVHVLDLYDTSTLRASLGFFSHIKRNLSRLQKHARQLGGSIGMELVNCSTVCERAQQFSHVSTHDGTSAVADATN